MKNKYNIKFRNEKLKLLLFAIMVCLFLQPFLWYGQDVYNLGGDDSRLQFYAPREYANNVALYSWFGTAFGSYNPQQFYLPFLAFGTILSYLFSFANLQSMIYGLILSWGFLAVYLLLQEISRFTNAGDKPFYAFVVGGLSYVFFPLAYIFWGHPLVGEITEFVADPLLLLFLFKAVNSMKIKYLIYGSVLVMIFDPGALLSPRFYALLIGIFLFLLTYILLFKEKRKLIIRYSMLYSVIFLALNSFWIVPSLLAWPTYQALISDVFGSSVAVRYIAPHMSLYHTLIGLPSPWLTNNAYLEAVAPLGVLLFLGFFLAFLLRPSDPFQSNLKKTWISLALAMVFLAYLQTVNVGDLGMSFFVWLVKNVPGWLIFRNFYRVFPRAYALFFALTIGESLYIVAQHPKIKGRVLPLKKITAVSTAAIIILEGVPLIKGDVINQPVSLKGDVSITRNVKIPQYYFNLIEYINKLEEGRILSLPLLKGGWSFIKSERGNGVYIGTSPVRILAGRYDITGLGDLLVPQIAPLGQVAKASIEAKKYPTLKNFLGLLSVKYILYDPEAFSILIPQKVGDVESIWGYGEFQTEESIEKMIKVMSAVEIARFGPISVYELPEEYVYPFIYATEDLAYFGGSLESFLELPIHTDIPKKAFYLGNDKPALEAITTAFIYARYSGDRYYDVYIPKEGIYTIYEDIGKDINSFNGRFIKIGERAFEQGIHHILFSAHTHITQAPPRGYLISSQFVPHVRQENPVLGYIKISPVEYRIKINATSPFYLVLSDTYDPRWIVQFDGANEIAQSKTPEPYHFEANGYANAWYINKTGTYTITLKFWPQKLFYMGLAISFATLITCIVMCIVMPDRKLSSNQKSLPRAKTKTNSLHNGSLYGNECARVSSGFFRYVYVIGGRIR